MNIKNIEKEFGSIRRITILTPDTFTKKLIVISTLFSIDSKIGETAVKQVSALNSLCIENLNDNFKAIKKHNTLEEAMEFHDNYIEEQKFISCEKVVD